MQACLYYSLLSEELLQLFAWVPVLLLVSRIDNITHNIVWWSIIVTVPVVLRVYDCFFLFSVLNLILMRMCWPWSCEGTRASAKGRRWWGWSRLSARNMQSKWHTWFHIIITIITIIVIIIIIHHHHHFLCHHTWGNLGGGTCYPETPMVQEM